MPRGFVWHQSIHRGAASLGPGILGLGINQETKLLSIQMQNQIQNIKVAYYFSKTKYIYKYVFEVTE